MRPRKGFLYGMHTPLDVSRLYSSFIYGASRGSAPQNIVQFCYHYEEVLKFIALYCPAFRSRGGSTDLVRVTPKFWKTDRRAQHHESPGDISRSHLSSSFEAVGMSSCLWRVTESAPITYHYILFYAPREEAKNVPSYEKIQLVLFPVQNKFPDLLVLAMNRLHLSSVDKTPLPRWAFNEFLAFFFWHGRRNFGGTRPFCATPRKMPAFLRVPAMPSPKINPLGSKPR